MLIILLSSFVFDLLNFISCQQSSGFPKEINLYAVFPPILERRDGIPLGHLRPLGWQRRAEAAVLEDSPNIKPEYFYKMFVQGNRSVIIRGIVPSLDMIWTDAYLSSKFGDRNVTVAKRKQRLVDTLLMMPLKTFLEQYRNDDLYMNTIIPDEMKLETPLPSLINCGTFGQRLLEPVIWISAGDTASLLQSRARDVLHCVLDGRKDFIILDTGKIYPNDFDLVKQNNSDVLSRIDVDMVNAYKYKSLHNLPWYWATLREGDCLFIPHGIFHQVRAHGRTIALSIDMAPPDVREDFDGNDCPKDPPVYVTLDKGLFQWRYQHGVRHLSKRTVTVEDARNSLLLLLASNDRLHKDIFIEFYNQATFELSKKVKNLPTAEEQWNQINMGEESQDYVNRSRLKSLSATVLQNLADVFQKSARIHDYDRLEL